MRKLTHDEISENRSTLDTLHKVKKLPVYVMLNSIRSSYNVGSIFRTSDGAMVEKLILCGYTPHPPIPVRKIDPLPTKAGLGMPNKAGNKEVLKTALGSTQSVEWEYIKNPLDALKGVKAKGIKICALELTENSKPYYDLTENVFPLCLVVGNEITGVSQEILDLCDYSIEIPQYGIKQSLNVAVAYGIAIFELRKIFNSKS
jgi:23S rRNA (guanosine2251-2'-O)-methyltransferase